MAVEIVLLVRVGRDDYYGRHESEIVPQWPIHELVASSFCLLGQLSPA